MQIPSTGSTTGSSVPVKPLTLDKETIQKLPTTTTTTGTDSAKPEIISAGCGPNAVNILA